MPRSIDRGRLIRTLQGVLIVCLALGAVSFLAMRTVDVDCCLPPSVFALFPIAEIILVLVALGLRWWFGRSGPLALVDGVIAAPLPVFLAYPQPENLPLLWPAAAIGFVAALVGAILCIVEVRRHPIERLAVAAGFAALTVAILSVVVILPVPVLLLLLTVWPAIRMTSAVATEGQPGPARASAPARRAPSARRTSEPPLVVGASGRLEPDVRAILGRRPTDDPTDTTTPGPARDDPPG